MLGVNPQARSQLCCSMDTLCSDEAAQSNKPILKEGTQPGLGEENSSSRKIKPVSGLSGVREE